MVMLMVILSAYATMMVVGKHAKRTVAVSVIVLVIILISGGVYFLLTHRTNPQFGKNFSVANLTEMSDEAIRKRLTNDIGYSEEKLDERESYEGVFQTPEAAYFSATAMNRLEHPQAALRIFAIAESRLGVDAKNSGFYIDYAYAASAEGDTTLVETLRKKALEATVLSPENERTAEERQVEREFANMVETRS